MIGMGLGEPLPDDMSEWPDADIQKAKKTVEKIRVWVVSEGCPWGKFCTS